MVCRTRQKLFSPFFRRQLPCAPVPPPRTYRISCIEPLPFLRWNPSVTAHSQGFALMECRATVPLRTELLTVLDEQIEMLTKKTFSSFTSEEMGAFKNREQRIRELQEELELVSARTAQFSDTGVFSAVYH